MRSICSVPQRCRFRPAVGIGLLALVTLGCGGRGDVSGKVTYQGKAVPFGTVLFEGSDGHLSQGNIGTDGSYSVTPPVATGEARVAVSSPNPRSSDLMPVNREGAAPLKPPPDVPGWFPIPKEYGTPSTSGLTYTIKRGANRIDIELK